MQNAQIVSCKEFQTDQAFLPVVDVRPYYYARPSPKTLRLEHMLPQIKSV